MERKITFNSISKGIPVPKKTKRQTNPNLEIDKPYARLPLVIQVVSKRGSGKSYTISNTLLNEDLIGRKRFSSIYYFNPNHWSDPSWKQVKLRTMKQFTGEYDEDDKPIYKQVPYDYHFVKMDYSLIDEILTEQIEILDEIKDENRLPQILIVVDDIVLPANDMDKEANPISKIIRNGRHYGLTLIYSIQRMKQLVSTVLRDNTDLLIFWVANNANMLESIYDYYFRGYLDRDIYNRLISKLRIKDHHNFLLLNMKNDFSLFAHIDRIGFGEVNFSNVSKN